MSKGQVELNPDADLVKQFTRATDAEVLDTLIALARAHPGDTPGTFVR